MNDFQMYEEGRKEAEEKQYSEDWIRDCIKYYGKVLTGDKAHWCLEWDQLPIDETCGEFKVCTCHKE